MKNELQLLRKRLRLLKNLVLFIISDFKKKFIYQIFPPKPQVINLNANDICNSKCTMCNIWQQKKDFEINPSELYKILIDNYFQDVKHIGITGGEPTLRKDLPLLYEACCKAIPSLKGLSIITNAIKEKDVIESIKSVNNICKRYGKSFSIMVSLDGVGEVHDNIRGRKGNFTSALNVIDYFKTNTDIPISIGCTISKDNLWQADELLDILKEKNIYGRFRVAEYIKRLYNEDRSDVIRNYTREEQYHLACFFKKLEITYETDPNVQRTYSSVINILEGGKRKIGCPYHDKAIVLDSRADMQFCAPKSKKIGNALQNSASKIVRNELQERRRIIKQDCDDCIHDYHAPMTFKEKIEELNFIFWKDLYTIKNINKAKYLIPFIKLLKVKEAEKRIFITGWYGTETVGDKAILGHIYGYYANKYPDAKFYVSSLYPFVTKKTLEELNLNAEIVPVKSFEFARISATADEIIMGGGPLMDMETLSVPLWAFKLAKIAKRKTVIFGCGLGPLKFQKYRETTRQILQLADEIKLRDENSIKVALDLDKNLRVENYGDGASYFIASKIKEKVKRKPILACYLREWPFEYADKDTTYEEYLVLRKQHEGSLAKMIKSICLEYNLKPCFYPMHTFFVGNDDRDFQRRFTREYFGEFDFNSHEENSSVGFIVEKMQEATLNLCMRFHSVLIANTLGTEFYAIDYTNGGKINGYLRDCNKSNRMKPISALADFNVLEEIGDLTHESQI